MFVLLFDPAPTNLALVEDVNGRVYGASGGVCRNAAKRPYARRLTCDDHSGPTLQDDDDDDDEDESMFFVRPQRQFR